MKNILFIFLFICTGCASHHLQSSKLERSSLGISQKKNLEVPFIVQEQFYCGPSTLNMVLSYYNEDVSLEKISKMTFTPRAKGTFNQDMITAARRNGFLSFVIKDFKSLLKEVDAGHPVIVFQNLGFDWYPIWHYSVVKGYDLSSQKILMHSGEKKDLWLDFDKFERGWRRADYFAQLLIPAGKLALTKSEKEQILEILILEKLGFARKAEKAYLAILKKFPKNHLALFALSNLKAKEKDFESGITYLKRAVLIEPKNYMFRYNLSFLYFKNGMKKEALNEAKVAKKLLKQNSLEKKYQEGLNKLIEMIQS